jgi:hypothetical protein
MNKDADQILVKYSLNHPTEALRVLALLAKEQEEDELLYFRGEVSSLRRSTPPDPAIPLLSPEDQITRIDRWEAPFNPESPTVLEENISLESLLV